MTKLSSDYLRETVLWLEECDASPSMREAFLKVSRHLQAYIFAREKEATVRALMKESGQPRKKKCAYLELSLS